MTDTAFLATLVDSLLPGGVVTEQGKLPSASAVGCDRALAGRSDRLDALIAITAHRAGGRDNFVIAASSVRATILQAVQAEEPEAFAELVTLTLSHYYAQPEVLTRIGWRARPPQPDGHALQPFDERLLAPVRLRGAFWRQV